MKKWNAEAVGKTTEVLESVVFRQEDAEKSMAGLKELFN